VLFKCSTAVHSEWKPVTGPVIIEKKLSLLYDEIKIPDKCAFSDG